MVKVVRYANATHLGYVSEWDVTGGPCRMKKLTNLNIVVNGSVLSPPHPDKH